MDLLLILTYAAVCIAIFKVFKIPLNKWSVPTAVLGGFVLVGGLIVVMNYNHPYSEKARKYALTTPIVPTVSGRVTEVMAQPNTLLEQGDVLFQIEDATYQNAVDALQAQLTSAMADYERAKRLADSNTGPKRDVDLSLARVQALEAQLQTAQFNLQETTVTAPTRGYVTQILVRPGMMAVNLPLRPVMIFVHDEADIFVAWFRQNSLLRLTPGDTAEVAFDGIPGEVFSGEVLDVYPLMAEGQLQPTGTIGVEDAPAGRVPVRIRITDPGFVQYQNQLPSGAYGQAALYSTHFHHVAVMRKVLLRMAAWLNYIFPFH